MERFQTFSSMEELLAYAREDKYWCGEGAAQMNRYPVRFILFENFSDFSEFVYGIEDAFDEHVFVQGIGKLIDEEYPDSMLTQDALGQDIVSYIKRLPTNDFVFAPFSELARFYDNDKYREFDSLVSTIRLAEPPLDAQKNHQRIYIPLIGMQGKMGAFSKDPNIHIWEYRSQSYKQSYQLVLTPGTTYGVQGIGDKYSTVETVKEWLDMWCNASQVSQRIICSSHSIFSNAQYAMPDNAFSYCMCNNAFEFLTKGLELDFGDVVYKSGEDEYWETLASEIDINSFDFDAFVSRRFDTYGITDGVCFVKTWFECDTTFDRWLLSIYYQMKFDDSDYLFRVLRNCDTLNTPNFIATLAMLIFGEHAIDEAIAERKDMLLEVSGHKVVMPEYAERHIKARLCAIASDPEKGYDTAAKFLTPVTLSERELMVEWLGRGCIHLKDIQGIYPELADYVRPISVQSEADWLVPYFDEYRADKLANRISDKLSEMVNQVNGSVEAFNGWHDKFKTVRTILANRSDIDLFYWIDGLGVDWIPYICSIVERHKFEGVYLNEVYIATCQLPSRTSNNKLELQKLASGNLPKIGDLDSFAHTNKKYPTYIAQELSIVTEAVLKVLSIYSGKKIAFISDHGISYMPQLAQSLGLTGYDADHGGRCAIRVDGIPTIDNNYFILDDNKTVCALRHNSLTSKITSGQGAHGGALPEEVLVPIIIVSSHKNANVYTVRLLTTEILASSPVVRLNICGLSSVDMPALIYNGIQYALKKVDANTYESERLNLVDTCKTIQVVIGSSFKESFPISVQTGVEEDDLFGDL